METCVAAGAGGFCTFAVLPPPQLASSEIIAAGRRKRIHRLVATQPSCSASCLTFNRIDDRTAIPNSIEPNQLRLLSRAPQLHNLRTTGWLRRDVNGQRSGIETHDLWLEGYRQSA